MWRKRLITTVSTRQYSSKAFTRVHETKPIGMDSQESPKAKLEKTDIDANAKATEEKDEAPKRQKTVLEQDEELRLKLEGISGEGGGAGVEYEGGKAVGLKRGVKENMFRNLYYSQQPQRDLLTSSIPTITSYYNSWCLLIFIKNNLNSLTYLKMASTRSTPEGSSPAPTNGTKRAAESTSSPPAAKRGRGRPKKQQKTLEETGGVGTPVKEQDVEDDTEVAKQIDQDTTPSEPAKRGRGRPKKVQNETKGTDGGTENVNENTVVSNESKDTNRSAENGVDKMSVDDDEATTKQNGNGGKVNGEKNAFDEVKSDEQDVKKAADEEQEVKSKEVENNKDSVVKDDKREAAIPSSILEKGIIYFFFRGRVGVEDPQGIEDVARSYIVLRPLPLGAKLGEGPLEDSGNARLLALPKKMLPKSRQDRFLVFVENPSATIKDLREQFSSNDYATKTSGTSHTPSATPFAEGIYAITSTGRESHLAYLLTVPSSIGEVQKELGLNEKGSFVVSAKNPNAPGPANATLDNPADYPEEIQKKFRDLRWMPLEPALLAYQNTQFLLIGEGMGDVDNAVQEMKKDAKDDEKVKPVEELEKLEEEDHDRVEHLKGDDPIFADLGLSSKEYDTLQTTW